MRKRNWRKINCRINSQRGRGHTRTLSAFDSWFVNTHVDNCHRLCFFLLLLTWTSFNPVETSWCTVNHSVPREYARCDPAHRFLIDVLIIGGVRREGTGVRWFVFLSPTKMQAPPSVARDWPREVSRSLVIGRVLFSLSFTPGSLPSPLPLDGYK